MYTQKEMNKANDEKKKFLSGYMTGITDFKEYIETILKIKDDNILLLVSVRDTPGCNFTDEYVDLWKKLGFRCSLKDKHWCGYIGVTDFKELYFEKVGNIGENVEATMDADAQTHIKILSSPFKAKNTSEIIINGEEYSDNFRGLNMVLYNEFLRYHHLRNNIRTIHYHLFYK